MSADSHSLTIRERIEGKWQLPLLALSTFLFVTTLVASHILEPVPTAEERVEEIRALKTELLLPEAESLARSILEDGGLAPDQLGPIHAELADIYYRLEAPKLTHDDKKVIRIPSLYAQSELAGHLLTGDNLSNLGQAYEWLGQPSKALEQYRLALDRSPSDPLEVHKRALVLELQQGRTADDELLAEFNDLLLESRQRPEIMQWVLEQTVQLLANLDRMDDATALLEKHAGLLKSTNLEPELEYLTAWLHYRAKRYDEAELTLRELRNRHRVRDEVHAKSGWLLGTVLLADDGPKRPMQAMVFFSDVLESQTTGEYVSASRIGMAEALSAMQRYDEAWSYYQAALADLKDRPHTRLVNPGAMRRSLTLRSQMQKESGHLESALDYMRLASELVALGDIDTRAAYLNELAHLEDLVAKLKRRQASEELSAGNEERGAELAARSRELFQSAAEDFLRLSKLKTADEAISAKAMWQAADMFDSAGMRSRTISLLQGFLKERQLSDLIPEARYRLGQALQAAGRLPSAAEQYQRCSSDYARTTHAVNSIIPLAECYLMMGPDHFDQAEETLRWVLEEPPGPPSLFTPESRIYRDSLFKLGELYSRQGRYEEAIERLEEALLRYANDDRQAAAMFMLADAYRLSGLSLEREAAEVSNALRREEMYETKGRRLRRAEELFGRVINKLFAPPSGELTKMEALQLELSFMYRADCAFDLGENERALDSYREVIRVYPQKPVTLSAYVQLVNCLESLGRTSEVRPALQRAEWLTDKIEPAEFGESLVHNDAKDWHKVFAWLGDTRSAGQVVD